MQKIRILSGLFVVALAIALVQPAFAQYDVSDSGIYQAMEASKNKVALATSDDALGSGTPIFAADGVLGGIDSLSGNLWRNSRNAVCPRQKGQVCRNGQGMIPSFCA